MLTGQPANRPAPGTAIVTDKGLAGEGTEEFFARRAWQQHLEVGRVRRDSEEFPQPWRWLTAAIMKLQAAWLTWQGLVTLSSPERSLPG